MKKRLLQIGGGLLGLLLLALLVVYFSLNSLVRSGVETFGTRMTQAPTKLEGVSISLFSGRGEIDHFELGNPKGYKAPFAIRMKNARLALEPGSLLKEKIIVREILLTGPEITLEGSLTGNNLSTLLKNVEQYTAAEETTQADPPKLQVNHFKVTGAKVHLAMNLLEGKSVPLLLPDLELHDLGTGPNGITAGELAQQVLRKVLVAVTQAVAANLDKYGGAVGEALKSTGRESLERLQDTREGVRELFRKSR